VGGAVGTLSRIAAATLAALANGDWLRINVQSGTYAETLTIANTTDSITRPILWLGFETTPFASAAGATTQVGDGCPNGNRPVITGGSARSNCVVSSIANLYQHFGHFRFTAATSSGIQMSSVAYVDFNDCVCDHCGSHGFNCANLAHFRNCTANNNGGYGFSAYERDVFDNCAAYSNGGSAQFRAASYTLYSRCRAWGLPSAGYGIYHAGSVLSFAINCTIDGGSLALGAYGIGSALATSIAVIDCQIINCSYPVALGGDKSLWCFASRNNIYNYNSLTNFANYLDPTHVDPQFVDATNHDYSLCRNSPLIGIGSGGGDIGALQSRQGILVPGGLS
jgi:hypothetical protein